VFDKHRTEPETRPPSDDTSGGCGVGGKPETRNCQKPQETGFKSLLTVLSLLRDD